MTASTTTPSGRLNPEQLRLFAAAADRILPGGDGPGALDADVTAFIDHVSGFPTFSEAADILCRGLSLLQSMAQVTYGQDFECCSAEHRDEILGRMQRIPHLTLKKFFALLVRLTLAGFLCDPAHDGNRDRVGWRYLGVDFERRPCTSARGAGRA